MPLPGPTRIAPSPQDGDTGNPPGVGIGWIRESILGGRRGQLRCVIWGRDRQALDGPQSTGESGSGRRRGRPRRGRSARTTGKPRSEPGSSGTRSRPGDAAEREAQTVRRRLPTQQHHPVLHVQDPGSPSADLHGMRMGLLSESRTRTQSRSPGSGGWQGCRRSTPKDLTRHYFLGHGT